MFEEFLFQTSQELVGIYLNLTFFLFLSKPLLNLLSCNSTHIISIKVSFYKKTELRRSQGLPWWRSG